MIDPNWFRRYLANIVQGVINHKRGGDATGCRVPAPKPTPPLISHAQTEAERIIAEYRKQLV